MRPDLTATNLQGAQTLQVCYFSDCFEHMGSFEMRTTLAIDDDVFTAVKSLAAVERQTVGAVLSALARQALNSNPQATQIRNGVPLLPVRPHTKKVTQELVKQLQDELL